MGILVSPALLSHHPFELNLLLNRIVSPGMSLLAYCCSLVRIKCFMFLLGIVHILNSSSTAALTFLLSSSFIVRWFYHWNIQLRRRELLALINEFLVQRGTSIIISPEESSRYDLSLDCVKLSYLETQNKISYVGPGIDPHMPILLDPFKDVVLIVLYFHVAFKVELLTFTRVMRCDKDPLDLNPRVIYIIWYQEIAL